MSILEDKHDLDDNVKDAEEGNYKTLPTKNWS